jgi:hypothetical protein
MAPCVLDLGATFERLICFEPRTLLSMGKKDPTKKYLSEIGGCHSDAVEEAGLLVWYFLDCLTSKREDPLTRTHKYSRIFSESRNSKWLLIEKMFGSLSLYYLRHFILPETSYTTWDTLYYLRRFILPETLYNTWDTLYYLRHFIIPETLYTTWDTL